MIFENINYLLEERGAPLLSADVFLKLSPVEFSELILELSVPLEIISSIDLRQKSEILAKKKLKLLVLDVDGVFTDGGLFYTSSGDEIKKFNVKDGMAITKAIERGKEIGIISAASRSEVVKIRAAILGIQNLYVGKSPKLEVLESWLYTMNLSFDEVAYIGDDINDIGILEKVGVGACPSDAVREVKLKADIILKNPGGQGCIREFIEAYMN